MVPLEIYQASKNYGKDNLKQNQGTYNLSDIKIASCLLKSISNNSVNNSTIIAYCCNIPSKSSLSLLANIAKPSLTNSP